MASIADTGRNDPCPCGSGKKFKRCCQEKIRTAKSSSNLTMVILIAALAAAAVAGVSAFTSKAPAVAPGKVWSPEHGHYH